MASVISASDKTNGIVGKPATTEADKSKPAAGPDVGVEEEEGDEDVEDEEDEYEEIDDEEERQMFGDDDDQEDEEGEQDGQDKRPSLTHFLLNDPEDQPEDNINDEDEDEFEEEDTEDIYVPLVPEPISRKRSHQEVAEDDEEPDSKKAKA